MQVSAPLSFNSAYNHCILLRSKSVLIPFLYIRMIVDTKEVVMITWFSICLRVNSVSSDCMKESSFCGFCDRFIAKIEFAVEYCCIIPLIETGSPYLTVTLPILRTT